MQAVERKFGAMNAGPNTASAVRWALAGGVAQRGAAFVGTLLICRIVAEEAFGAYRQVVAVHLVVSMLLPWGFDQLVVREANRRRRYLAALAGTVMLTGVFCAAMAALGQPMLAAALGLGDYRAALAVLPVSILFLIPKLTLKPRFVARLAFRAVAHAELLNVLTACVLVIPVLLWSPSALALACAFAAGELAEGLYLAAATRGQGRLRLPRLRVIRVLWRRHRRFSGIYTSDQVLNTFSMNAPVLLLGVLIGQKAVGAFSVAFMLIAGPLFVVASAVGRIVFPALAGRSHENLTRAVLTVLHVTAAVLPPAVVLVAFFAPELAGVALGPRWSPDVGLIVRLLAPYLCLVAVLSPVSSLDLLMDRPEVSLMWNAATALVRCIALVMAAPYGLAAAIGAYSAVSVAMLLILGFALSRIIGCPPLRFNGEWLRFVPVWAGMGALCLALRSSGLPAAAGAAIAGGALIVYYVFLAQRDAAVAQVAERVLRLRGAA